MFFKNLQIYKFTEQLNLAGVDIEPMLEPHKFKSPGAHDSYSQGFTPPNREGFIFEQEGKFLFCVQREDKVIPGGSINLELNKRIAKIEETEGRKLPRKERTQMKNEIIFEMLPRAFSTSSKIYGYIDRDWLIIDASSPRKAEDVLILLRKALGSLSVVPVATRIDANIIGVMTGWLENFAVNDFFAIEDESELRGCEDNSQIVKFKHQDMSLEEVKNHLDVGCWVHKLALNWRDRILFIIDETLQIKRLKFLDLIHEQSQEIEALNEQDIFSSDFAVMSGELDLLIDDLLSAFRRL